MDARVRCLTRAESVARTGGWDGQHSSSLTNWQNFCDGSHKRVAVSEGAGECNGGGGREIRRASVRLRHRHRTLPRHRSPPPVRPRSPRSFSPNRRRDLGTQQLDGSHDMLMRHGADGELSEEALMAEELVLEQDLVDDLLRTADQQRPAW